MWRKAQDCEQFVFRQVLHANKEATTMPITTGPFLNVLIKLLPAPQIEIAHTEVCMIAKLYGVLEGGGQTLFNVIENPRHMVLLSAHSVFEGAAFPKVWNSPRGRLRALPR